MLFRLRNSRYALAMADVPNRPKPPRIVEPVRHADGLCRCPWAGSDPLYVAYHDTEWGVPEWDDRALFEKLILDGFQAGLAWITILRKRDGFRRAFDGFEPALIARYDDAKVEQLMNDASIVRNRAKIVNTVRFARFYLGEQERGGFGRLLWSFVGGGPGSERLRHDRRGPGRKRRVQSNGEAPSRAGPVLLRADDPLRVHAGGRDGGRSSDRLLPAPRRLMAEAPTQGRAWQRMLSGRRLDLLDPRPEDIDVLDIAHGLARVARWNGQTAGPHIFSVAQHSLLVEAIASATADNGDECLAALLHDAPEYVVGDLISPFKAVLGDDYKAVEHRILAAVHTRFGLEPPSAAVQARMKAADRAAARLEATALAGFAEAEATLFFGAPPSGAERWRDHLAPQEAGTVQARFLARVEALRGG